MRAEASHDERVAVGRRLRHGIGADVAARAGAVLDYDRLTPALRHANADEARVKIGDAARRKRHHDLDRLGRIGLARGRREPGHGRERGGGKATYNGHGSIPSVV